MKHPYHGIPAAQRWSRSMARRGLDAIDPVSPPPFRIGTNARLITAGSCFAQHLARWLDAHGHPCWQTEPAHPFMDEELARRFNYGIYAARYGNIYTSRQLLQLWRRATGEFTPVDDVWEENGAWYDPFRPTIQPGGYPTRREYDEDRRQHFAAVRRAFGETDVLAFTLGLTECWASRVDGAVYPLCPGVAAGDFAADSHQLLNLTVDEVVADMRAFVESVRRVNPKLKLVLTVSPVPLAATAEPRHVWASTVYSKSVLRVAADALSLLPDVYYFPSYEIVLAGGGTSFAADRRSITEQAVERVMRLFAKHVLDGHIEAPSATRKADEHDAFLAQSRSVVEALCDEDRLDPVQSEAGQEGQNA